MRAPDEQVAFEAKEIGDIEISPPLRHGPITIRDCVAMVFTVVNGVPPRAADEQADAALRFGVRQIIESRAQDSDGRPDPAKIAAILMPHLVGASSNSCDPDKWCKRLDGTKLLIEKGECLCRDAAMAAAEEVVRALK